MNNQEEPMIQIIVDEIADHQERSIIKKLKKRTPVIIPTELPKAGSQVKQQFNGKQQFGDKSICRLCTKPTLALPLIMCHRCHFKYHIACIRQNPSEPQIINKERWNCSKCINRIEQLKQKIEKTRKKRKIETEVDEVTSNQSSSQNVEVHEQRVSDFLSKYPTYKNQGQILFPIIDEYLIAYSDLFQGETRKKPLPKEFQEIPAENFEQVLIIWDTYNNYDKIVSDFLYIDDDQSKNQNQMNIIGTFIHFRDNHKPYSQKTRQQIYETLKMNPVELILFFTYFYTKQLIEDVDIEQMQKQQYNCFWNLMGYLWYNNRNQYYEMLKESALNIISYLNKQGFFSEEKESEVLSSSIEEKPTKIILLLIEGLLDLKKTQLLAQFRVENLLSNNRIKVQLATEIKEMRSLQLEYQQQLQGLNQECDLINHKQSSGQLSKIETIKQAKEYEQISKQAELNKQEEEKVSKKLNKVQENYHQLEDELHQVQIPALMLNPSMFLGYDLKNCQYYFFLNERNKIFVHWKTSWISSEMKWGYYNFEDIHLFLKSLNIKGVKENQLKQNIEEIIKYKIFTNATQNVQEKQKICEGDSTEKEYCSQSNLLSTQKPIAISTISLANLLSEIESTLTVFLNEKNSRWCSPQIRSNFKKSYENQTCIQSISKAIEFFLENTQIQEKIELRKEGEIVEDNLYIDFDEDSFLYVPQKRKIIEDEATENEAFKQLESMDSSKIKVKRVPMRLFGTYFENLRANLIEQVSEKCCDVLQIKTCLVILKYIVKDYVKRKRQEQLKQLQKEKKVCSIEQQVIITDIKNTVKKQNEVIDVDNNWEETCKICGLGGKVLLCDSCPRVFHQRCIKLKDIPKGKWNCMMCQSYFSRQVKTRQTLKKLSSQ